ncbi:hypothetical protein AB1Y20_022760 [Prymnesium parvum]|uniref:Uncharacterized protein n=1 Tax=Prymnesium parvum TaxID=97485 RepID=A0AB34JI35_PRYPA
MPPPPPPPPPPLLHIHLWHEGVPRTAPPLRLLSDGLRHHPHAAPAPSAAAAHLTLWVVASPHPYVRRHLERPPPRLAHSPPLLLLDFSPLCSLHPHANASRHVFKLSPPCPPSASPPPPAPPLSPLAYGATHAAACRRCVAGGGARRHAIACAAGAALGAMLEAFGSETGVDNMLLPADLPRLEEELRAPRRTPPPAERITAPYMMEQAEVYFLSWPDGAYDTPALWEAAAAGALVFAPSRPFPPLASPPLVDGIHYVTFPPSASYASLKRLLLDHATAAPKRGARARAAVLSRHMSDDRLHSILHAARHLLPPHASQPFAAPRRAGRGAAGLCAPLPPPLPPPPPPPRAAAAAAGRGGGGLWGRGVGQMLWGRGMGQMLWGRGKGGRMQVTWRTAPRREAKPQGSWLCGAHPAQVLLRTRDESERLLLLRNLSASCPPDDADAAAPPPVHKRWACDKLPDSPPSPPFPARHVRASLAVGLLVPPRQQHTAAFTASLTWLASFRHSSLFPFAPPLPTAALRALSSLHAAFPRCAWFTLARPDTYLEPDATRAMLSSLDASQPLWIASSAAEEKEGAAQAYHYAAEGSVWFLSRPAAASYAAALPAFERSAASAFSSADRAIGALLSRLGIAPAPLPFPFAALTWAAVDDEQSLRWAKGAPCALADLPRFAFFYHVPPRAMLALHSRAAHASLDASTSASSLSAWRLSLAARDASAQRLAARHLSLLCPSSPPPPPSPPLAAPSDRSLLEAHLSRLAAAQLLVGTHAAARNAAPLADLPPLTLWGARLASCEQLAVAVRLALDLQPRAAEW